MHTELNLPRARRTRLAAKVVLWVWIATLLVFMVGVAVKAGGAVLAGLGGLASMLFAACFGLNALASRRELREFAEATARHDLRAARSRRASRPPSR